MCDTLKTIQHVDNEDLGVHTYIITPKYKQSVMEESIWTKSFGDILVKVKIETTWRWGKFTAKLYEKDINDMRELMSLVLNDYGSEICEVNDSCFSEVVIQGIDSYSDDMKTTIYASLYQDIEREFLFDESEMSDEHGWTLCDTTYIITGGADIVPNTEYVDSDHELFTNGEEEDGEEEEEEEEDEEEEGDTGSTASEPLSILVDSSPNNTTNIFYTCTPDYRDNTV